MSNIIFEVLGNIYKENRNTNCICFDFDGRKVMIIPSEKSINSLKDIDIESCDQLENIQDIYIPNSIKKQDSINFFKLIQNIEKVFIEEGSEFEGCCLGRLINNENEKIDGIYSVEECIKNDEDDDSKKAKLVVEFSTVNDSNLKKITNDYIDTLEEVDKNTVSLFNLGGWNFVFPEKIHTIKAGAFLGNQNVVTIGGIGITTVEDNAIKGCLNLLSVSIPKVIDSNKVGEDILMDCNKIEVVHVGNREVCSKISRNLPSNVETKMIYGLPAKQFDRIYVDGKIDAEIADFTIENYSSVVLPSEVEIIKKGTFANNKDIRSINANNVTEIEDGAFKGCTNLESFFIKGVTDPDKLGKSILEGCSNLKAVWVANEEICEKIIAEHPLINFKDKLLYGDPRKKYRVEQGNIYVDGKIDAEIADFTIEDYSSVVLPSEVEIIKKGTFANKEEMRAIDANSVTEIEDEAFKGCTNLESFSIKGVTDPNKLGKNILEGCSNLNMVWVANEEICEKIIAEHPSIDFKDKLLYGDPPENYILKRES